MMMRMRTGVVVGYWPSDGCLIPGLRDRRPPRGPVSVSNIHSIIHPGSSTTSWGLVKRRLPMKKNSRIWEPPSPQTLNICLGCRIGLQGNLGIMSCSGSVPKIPSLCQKVHTLIFAFQLNFWQKWWLPHKAGRNAKDLILKFCHSFRDPASPLA